ncbi:hypothetical protein F6Y05_36350 [Bacillus megaterium]|nr:hypothetical protein [Priestia megaterium]
MLENKIHEFVDQIYDSKVNNDVLALAEQTYLRRILDSYFEDVNIFIKYDSLIGNYTEGLSLPKWREGEVENLFKIESKKNNATKISKLMDIFNDEAIRFLKRSRKVNIDSSGFFNYKQITAITNSYKDFIMYFSKIF